MHLGSLITEEILTPEEVIARLSLCARTSEWRVQGSNQVFRSLLQQWPWVEIFATLTGKYAAAHSCPVLDMHQRLHEKEK